MKNFLLEKVFLNFLFFFFFLIAPELVHFLLVWLGKYIYMKKNLIKKNYFGLADTTFKERYRNQIRDFKHEKQENSTALTKYTWQLKRDNISFSVKWLIITKVYGSPNPLLCKLLLTEKLWIINFMNDGNMLNKRSELLSRCRHLKKHLLRNVKEKQ